ncbi:hypothetical protein [Marinitenerispora sediminis]|uniref:hypothetical protein n=2 Tax=Marinitenerispora sediminis TaxID=1931232 RepID=UPI0011C032ED|nr:hypothetical protein [Marinitenerispora sediminis]
MPELALAAVLVAGTVLAARSVRRIFEFMLDAPALFVRNAVESAQLDVRVSAVRHGNELLDAHARRLTAPGGPPPDVAGIRAEAERVQNRILLLDADSRAEQERIEREGEQALAAKQRSRRIALGVEIVLLVVGVVLVAGAGVQGISLILAG